MAWLITLVGPMTGFTVKPFCKYLKLKGPIPSMLVVYVKNIFLHKNFLSTIYIIYINIHNDINEQDTSFLDCKHKHMMKSEAPPDKIGVLHRLLPVEFDGFTSRIDF